MYEISAETTDKLKDLWQKSMPFTDEFPKPTSQDEWDERAKANGEFFTFAWKQMPSILMALGRYD